MLALVQPGQTEQGRRAGPIDAGIAIGRLIGRRTNPHRRQGLAPDRWHGGGGHAGGLVERPVRPRDRAVQFIGHRRRQRAVKRNVRTGRRSARADAPDAQDGLGPVQIPLGAVGRRAVDGLVGADRSLLERPHRGPGKRQMQLVRAEVAHVAAKARQAGDLTGDVELAVDRGVRLSRWIDTPAADLGIGVQDVARLDTRVLLSPCQRGHGNHRHQRNPQRYARRHGTSSPALVCRTSGRSAYFILAHIDAKASYLWSWRRVVGGRPPGRQLGVDARESALYTPKRSHWATRPERALAYRLET